MKPLRNAVGLAVLFESGLGLLGLALAWWMAVPVGERLTLTLPVAWRCVWAMLPMLGLLAIAMWATWEPVARLRRMVRGLVRSAFAGARWWNLAAVALAAGAGEELLFRGALQPLAMRWVGPALGVILVSILFGALHAASRLYFVMATGVGLYLGWLAAQYDDLVVPIVMHAAYDWAAIVLLLAAAPAANLEEPPV